MMSDNDTNILLNIKILSMSNYRGVWYGRHIELNNVMFITSKLKVSCTTCNINFKHYLKYGVRLTRVAPLLSDCVEAFHRR